MATFQDLMTTMREDYLSDTFEGMETATPSEMDANVLWKDRQLLRFLVEAQEEACMRADLIHDENMIVDLVEGERKYVIDPVAIRISRVSYNGVELTHASRHDLDYVYPEWRTRSGMQGQALYYYMNGYNMSIFPTPDAADITINAEIKVEGYRLPLSNILSSDELEIPLTMHKNVMWYALHMAYAMADADALNYKESEMYLKKFDSAFGPKIDNRVIIHQLEEPPGDGFLGPIDYLG